MKTTLTRFRCLRRFRLLMAVALPCFLFMPASAQTAQDDEQDGGRGIVPVFSNARSQSSGSGSTAKAAPVYRRIARSPRQKPSSRLAASAKRPNNLPATKRPVVSLDAARNLGVTIWKLQPGLAFADFNQPACRGAQRTIAPGGGRDIGQPVMITPPMRSSSETLFHTGDRIRLSIESTRPGYLYIIDRELHADGTYGAPKLLFPTKRIRGGNNYLAPGSPVEFPDLCDNANYFEFLPSRPGQSPVAEALTMIVTDKPLTDIGVPPDAGQIPESWLKTWEARWPSRSNIYELDEGEGQLYTTLELNAGFEIRQQGRPGTRALGQGGPQPQTLYSVDAPGDGMMTTILLWYE